MVSYYLPSTKLLVRGRKLVKMRYESYAQELEDIILYVALQDVDEGFYIDIGANDPIEISVTKFFYDRGWSGINVEPLRSKCALLENERPRDINLCIGISDRRGETAVVAAGSGSTFSDKVAQNLGYSNNNKYMKTTLTLSDIFEKYPSLKAFAEKMTEVAENILTEAVKASDENNRNYIAELGKYNKPGEPIIIPALLDDMLADSGMVEDTILHDDSIELCLTEQAANNRYRERYDANSSTEIEIICAKHALWIYDEKGGKRADFSNSLLENVDLSNCNLCGADFSGAVFINCNLDDASMCDADFKGAKFKQCSLRHFTAEGANFTESDFYNSDLRGAYFTASNFTNAKMADCNFHEASFMNCCLESWITTDCNLKIADMRNVSYDESAWLEDNNECMSMGGM